MLIKPKFEEKLNAVIFLGGENKSKGKLLFLNVDLSKGLERIMLWKR